MEKDSLELEEEVFIPPCQDPAIRSMYETLSSLEMAKDQMDNYHEMVTSVRRSIVAHKRMLNENGDACPLTPQELEWERQEPKEEKMSTPKRKVLSTYLISKVSPATKRQKIMQG